MDQPLTTFSNTELISISITHHTRHNHTSHLLGGLNDYSKTKTNCSFYSPEAWTYFGILFPPNVYPSHLFFLSSSLPPSINQTCTKTGSVQNKPCIYIGTYTGQMFWCKIWSHIMLTNTIYFKVTSRSYQSKQSHVYHLLSELPQNTMKTDTQYVIKLTHIKNNQHVTKEKNSHI